MFTLCLTAFGCKRKVDTAASINIQIPEMRGSQKNLSALSFPSTGTLCFIANATASDIKSTQDTCLPEIGILSQFGKPGEEIILNSVPSGDNRKFEIYLFIVSAGQTCPAADFETLIKLDYSKFYSVGMVDGISISKDEETVNIDIAFPGAANSFLPKYSALGCAGNVAPVTPTAEYAPEKVNLGGGIITGGSYKIRASVGGNVSSKEITGGSYKIKVK